jgi:hypothetical protein
MGFHLSKKRKEEEEEESQLWPKTTSQTSASTRTRKPASTQNSLAIHGTGVESIYLFSCSQFVSPSIDYNNSRLKP